MKAAGRNPGQVLRKAMAVLLPGFRFASSGLQRRHDTVDSNVYLLYNGDQFGRNGFGLAVLEA
jgi:hypothetical protein